MIALSCQAGGYIWAEGSEDRQLAGPRSAQLLRSARST